MASGMKLIWGHAIHQDQLLWYWRNNLTVLREDKKIGKQFIMEASEVIRKINQRTIWPPKLGQTNKFNYVEGQGDQIQSKKVQNRSHNSFFFSKKRQTSNQSSKFQAIIANFKRKKQRFNKIGPHFKIKDSKFQASRIRFQQPNLVTLLKKLLKAEKTLGL